MIAEISANAKILIKQPIRKKQDALAWIREHWEVGKGIVHLWFEQRHAIEQDRQVAWEKDSSHLERMVTSSWNMNKTSRKQAQNGGWGSLPASIKD